MRVGEIDRILEERSDPEYKEFNSRIVPYEGKMYGVRMPALRSIAKDVIKGDWRLFLEEDTGSFEQSMIRALVIATAEMDADERLERMAGFVPEIDNWAVCDTFCGAFRTGPGNASEKLWHMCVELLGTGEEFPMRAGAVMMLDHFLDDRHIDEVIRLMCTVRSPGYYYDMGAAWTLSCCYISYPEKTEDAMFSICASNEILRMTVRKIRDSFRVSAADKERLKERFKGFKARS